MLDTNKYIRRLARSDYYQSIYNTAEKVNLKLFHNDVDLTSIQIRLLQYLNFYSGLYMDIYLGEVNEKVTENEVFEDSYSVYKRKRKKVEKDKLSKEKKQLREPAKVPQNEKRKSFNWVFKRN